MDQTSSATFQPDASELILLPDNRYVCETYIFDPVSEEESLGRLFAVAETEDRGGVGAELVDLTIQALQREYYRDPGRGILASFESALHQANLVLHDTAEQGVRDWMGYFHVAVGILARDNLHVSCAGNASIFLARKSRLTLVSADLSHSPITNPLRTFAQVASGKVQSRDVLYFGTSTLPDIFRDDELSGLSLDHSASSITTRLKQLYADKGAHLPLAVLTLSILPQHIVTPRQEVDAYAPYPTRPMRSGVTTPLTLRKPLIINRTWLMTLVVFIGRIARKIWQQLRRYFWPVIVRGSRHSRRVLAAGARGAGRNMQSLTQKQWERWRARRTTSLIPQATPSSTPTSRPAFPLRFVPSPLRSARRLPRSPGFLWQIFRARFRQLPRSSRIFAGLTLLLAVALVVSVILLKQKRAEEATIVRASEILHDARNSKTAAEDALIYDNRDQARALLVQAGEQLAELETSGRYTTEVAQLKSDLAAVSDRLQKIVRATSESTRVVGDFSQLLDGKTPHLLSLVNETLYTFNPETNAALGMATDGTVNQVTTTTQGTGFITTLSTHQADKLAVLGTSSPGIAVFDAKAGTVQNQEITLPSAQAQLAALATYGSRLYLYDSAAKNIFGYTKTLRGYTGGTAWITDNSFPKESVVSFDVDGNIYTLHSDGAIRKLLKGKLVTFAADVVDPPLAGATKLSKSEDLSRIYILDVANRRVVIFDEAGKLIRQLFIDVAQQLSDMAVNPDEKTIYVLDGTRVLAISLDK